MKTNAEITEMMARYDGDSFRDNVFTSVFRSCMNKTEAEVRERMAFNDSMRNTSNEMHFMEAEFARDAYKMVVGN